MKEELNSITETLKVAFQSHQIVSCYYYDSDGDACSDSYDGYIAAMDTEMIVIACISADGLYDGFVLEKIENVYRIDRDTYYEKKRGKLYSLKGSQHPKLNFSEEKNLLTEFLDYSMSQHLVITLILKSGDSPTGYLAAYTKDAVTLHQLNKAAEDMGTTVVRIGEILSLELDQYYEQCLRLLYEC